MPDPLSDLQRLGQEFDADGLTQADRDAAAAFATFTRARPDLEQAIVIGELDDNYIVQAFARHRIDAIAAALPAIEAEGWRPIESAPKDGTFVLLHVPQGLETGSVTVGAYWKEHERSESGRFLKGHWDGWLGMDGDILSSWCEPTHWRPLPAPPQLKDER